jgi:hypothetical protein
MNISSIVDLFRHRVCADVHTSGFTGDVHLWIAANTHRPYAYDRRTNNTVAVKTGRTSVTTPPAEELRVEAERLRQQAEAVRREAEQARQSAEHGRIATEQARIAAEQARDAAIEAVRTLGETLRATLEQMKTVEEMRRASRSLIDRPSPDTRS